jgi:cytochrome c-type biogenesis protein CcmE
VSARRARLLLLGLLLAGVTLLVTAGLQHTLTFYRTPGEVLDQGAGHRVRLGGQVMPGSLRTENGTTWFRIGDGAAQVNVEEDADLPGTIREGQDAVVEGALDDQGVFRSDTVMVKHGNEYRPASSTDGAASSGLIGKQSTTGSSGGPGRSGAAR